MRFEVKLIMFDLDGTLVDSTLDLAQSANYVRRRYGLTPLPIDAIRSFVGDGAWMLLERALADAPPGVLQEGYQLYKTHYSAHSTDFTWVYPGCLELLAALQHKKIAVVTNKPDKMSRQILDSYGLAPYIGLLVGADLARKKKPAPEHLQQALEWAECTPSEALMVGDSSNDVEGAAAAGVPCCGITFGIGKPEGRAGERPDFCISSLPELLNYIR